jgi:hypothetical protein
LSSLVEEGFYRGGVLISPAHGCRLILPQYVSMRLDA